MPGEFIKLKKKKKKEKKKQDNERNTASQQQGKSQLNSEPDTHQFFINLQASDCSNQWLFNYEDSRRFFNQWKIEKKKKKTILLVT